MKRRRSECMWWGLGLGTFGFFTGIHLSEIANVRGNVVIFGTKFRRRLDILSWVIFDLNQAFKQKLEILVIKEVKRQHKYTITH